MMSSGGWSCSDEEWRLVPNHFAIEMSDPTGTYIQSMLFDEATVLLRILLVAKDYIIFCTPV